MENFSKIVYFSCSVLSVFQAMFYLANFFNLAYDPSKKTSETFIFFGASCIVGAGLVVAYKYGFALSNIWTAVCILLASWVLALV
jgi:hypothetical protein